MSKRYKGKTCAYCAVEGSSTTGDHVFAREFFPLGRRDGLPKVPACKRCNNEKSAIEHYMTAVLPFAGRHADASEVLTTMVPARLAQNRRLHREITESWSTTWLKQGGQLRPSATLHLDADKLRSLVRYVVRGLVTYHWQTHIPSNYAVGVAVWSAEGERLMTSALPSSGRALAEKSWGEGAFEYRGIQASDDPHLSIWRLKLYGGALLGGETGRGSEASARIWAMTSRNAEPDLFEY